MGKPVLVVVDDEEASRQALARELEARYGTHYRIVSSVSPDEALAGLEQLRAEGADVPLVLADQWMPGMTGAQLLGRVRELHPTARRVLLVSWGDQSAAIPWAAALGQIDFFVFKPSWAPDEQFHRAVTESLEAWWRLRGGQFATVTVIGEEPSGRVHEIRDLLTRNNIPFGFTRADSPEGRAGLQRLGVPGASGPVVALFTGESWWTRPTRRWPRRSVQTCARRRRATTSSSSGPGRPGWPPRCTARPKGCARRCWSERRPEGRPARAR